MRLFAISDLHVGFPINRKAVSQLPDFTDDWLILAGDIAETEKHLRDTFELMAKRFKQVIWVPGNHELWSLPEPGATEPLHYGEKRYQFLVDLAREYAVITPEDPFPVWKGSAQPHVIAPLFVLYDYSFRPNHVSREQVIE